MKILLVDDNLLNQKLSKVILESRGYEVDLAHDGKDAVEKVLGGSFDIVFMDCRMPVMNGLDATKKIRKENKDTPIIALTLNDGPDIREKCFKVGMNDFIEKPFKPEDILEMVEKWVTHKK